MRIKDFMQTNIISVPSDTSLYEARRVMIENKVKRIPIVDNGRLVGITSLNKIREASPSSATDLSIHELHYLLAKMTVRDIMRTDIVTCNENDPVEDVGWIMHTRQIGGMPVLNARGELVGYVGSNDLFKVVIMMLGLDRPLSRITVRFKTSEVCSRLDNLVALLDRANLCVRSIVRFDLPDDDCDVVVRVEASEMNSFVDDAQKAGINVVSYLTGKKEVRI